MLSQYRMRKKSACRPLISPLQWCHVSAFFQAHRALFMAVGISKDDERVPQIP